MNVQNNYKKISKISRMSPYLSIIKLFINRVHSLIKRYTLAWWNKNQGQIKLHIEKISFPLMILTEGKMTETGITYWKAQKGKEA